MEPEDLADTIYVVRTGENGTIRVDRNCMLMGLPVTKEDAEKWEKTLRDYVRYLILKAIDLYDPDSEEPPAGSATAPRG